MFKKILTATALFALAATGLQAQQTSPDSVYNTPGLPVREAVTNALALKDDDTKQGIDRGNALVYVLEYPARDAATNELAPGLADRVIAGQELVGVANVPPRLIGTAHAFKARQLSTVEARFDYLGNVLETPGADYVVLQGAANGFVAAALSYAGQLNSTRKFAEAEAALTKALPYNPAQIIPSLVDAKKRLGKHAEAQGLAIAGWRISTFSGSGAAEALLFSAVANDPAKGLGTANAVREYINTGTGANPLAGITVPVIALKKTQSDAEVFLARTLSGDLDGALETANFIFAEAANVVVDPTSEASVAAAKKKQDAAAALVLAAVRNKAGTNAGPTEAKRLWIKNGGAAGN